MHQLTTQNRFSENENKAVEAHIPQHRHRTPRQKSHRNEIPRPQDHNIEIRGTKTPCIEKQRTETTIWRDFRDSITFFTKYKTYFSYTIILLFYIIILSCKEVRPSFLRNKTFF